MGTEQIEKILASAKVSMEMEGFDIDEELIENGRKILHGDISLDDYIDECKKRAMVLAREV
ncbi:MAG: antitoxin VbhA family protein [Oscillospiraceae bacterium]|jgi:hypothetical protein|nr:antitoxin VbhA family protein [Oscillospiraceae bacterium]